MANDNQGPNLPGSGWDSRRRPDPGGAPGVAPDPPMVGTRLASGNSPALPVEVPFLVTLLLAPKGLQQATAAAGASNLILPVYLGLLVAAGAALFRWRRRRLRSLFGALSASHVAWGLLAGVALFVAAGAGYTLDRIAFGLAPPAEAAVFRPETRLQAFVALAAALIAPLLEEYVFRGILQGGLEPRFGSRAGVIFSAALFALYHLSLFQLLPTFLLGIGLGVLAVRGRSLWPPLVAHQAFNALGFVLLFSGAV